jgi:hypothetical protein
VPLRLARSSGSDHHHGDCQGSDYQEHAHAASLAPSGLCGAADLIDQAVEWIPVAAVWLFAIHCTFSLLRRVSES